MVKASKNIVLLSFVILICAMMILASCDHINGSDIKVTDDYPEKITITDGKKLPDDGDVELSVTIEKYQDEKGTAYVSLKNITYEILGSYNFESVELTYCDGYDLYTETSYELKQEYILEANKVSAEDNQIKVSIVICMKNGEKINIEIP